jgi:hypothetical protein
VSGVAPAVITATVTDAVGQRLQDATLAVRQMRRLGCGCLRYTCDRPGGGLVDVLVGEHCFGFAGPLTAVPSMDEDGRRRAAEALDGFCAAPGCTVAGLHRCTDEQLRAVSA